MCTSYEYLLTTIGSLKILNIVFAVVSIGLIADTFVPVTEEIIFVSIVSTIFAISLVYLLSYLAWPGLITNKLNGRIDFVYHILAGLSLIVVGIDITSWEDYLEVCKYNCPSLYTKGVAKIFTFINGVLYGMVAFLNSKEGVLIKGEELTDSDLEDLDEFRPILKQPRNSRNQYQTM